MNFAGNADCPVSSGPVLVDGRGTATGPFGKFGSAISTAAECSAPGFGTRPTLGTCDPSSIRTFPVTFNGNDASNLLGQCTLFGLEPQPPPNP